MRTSFGKAKDLRRVKRQSTLVLNGFRLEYVFLDAKFRYHASTTIQHRIPRSFLSSRRVLNCGNVSGVMGRRKSPRYENRDQRHDKFGQKRSRQTRLAAAFVTVIIPEPRKQFSSSASRPSKISVLPGSFQVQREVL
jgi:hypothetical protein